MPVPKVPLLTGAWAHVWLGSLLVPILSSPCFLACLPTS